MKNSLSDYRLEEQIGGVKPKQSIWDMAIGLQLVDNLKPSNYLLKLAMENVNSYITLEEVEMKLKEYYLKMSKKTKFNRDEMECDFVSLRTVQILSKYDFELSVDYLKYIHEYLFQDIYRFAGKFRNTDISKQEKILNGDTIAYGYFRTLTETLEYDILLEKGKRYNEMNPNDIINSITKFSSCIWQTHPFMEGNTRTVILFIIKYLNSLGFNIDYNLFKNKTVYFRNALVRSNYFNNILGIEEDNTYLTKFYEMLLLGRKNILNLNELVVKELF